MPARYTYHLALSLPSMDSRRLTNALRAKIQAPQQNPTIQPSDFPEIFYALNIAWLAHSDLPHPFLRQRLTAALPEILPAAFPIQQSRITAIDHSAALSHPTPPSLREIHHFLTQITPHLTAQNLTATPIRPHIPLPLSAHAKTAIPQHFGWTADHLILSEFDMFTGLNRTVKSWPLPPPIQGSLPFPIAA